MSAYMKFRIGEKVMVTSRRHPNYGSVFIIKKVFEGLKNTMARYSSYMLYDKSSNIPQKFMYGDGNGVFYDENEIDRR